MKIATDFQYIAVMIVIESYLQKGFKNLSETEDRQLFELSKLVEKWEIDRYR